MKIFIIFICCCFPAFSFWADKTSLIKTTMIVVKNRDGAKKYADISGGNKVPVLLKSKESIQFDFFIDRPGLFTITKAGQDVLKKDLPTGKGEIKKFLESGTYTISFTGIGKFKFFIWKEREMVSLMPEGGGYPFNINVRKKMYTYYRANDDTIPKLKLKGPTVGYVFIRADIPSGKANAKMELQIVEGKSAK